MKKFIMILTLALLFSSTLSIAGELDNYYLEQFGELSPATADMAIKAATISSPRHCGMPLRRGLKQDWDQLAASTQSVLAKYLDKPSLGGEKIVRSNGNHFNIHYASAGANAPPMADLDNNGLPDWVEQVADVFEAVYAREVAEFGYTAPATPYDVYLQSLASQDEYGYTQSSSLNGVKATSYIVIDNSFTNFPLPYSPLTNLKITAAHEFHHAIQYGYNYYFDPWYAEATSTWMEDEVYDSGNQLYDYLPQYYQQTGLQLNTAVNVDTGGGYGRWPFNRYLAEVFAPKTIVRSIWARLATKLPVAGADIPMLPVINEALASSGSSLPASFLGFTKRFLLNNWASHQNEIGRFPTLDFSAGTYPVAMTFTAPAVNLPNYAFQYLKLLPSSATPSQLAISYPAKPSGYAMIAFLQSAGVTSQFPADVSGNIVIPSTTSADTIYLLICNNVSGTTSMPAEPTQVIPPPVDATNPYTGVATFISPLPATASYVAAGGGGGCFIATAAYGSYLHPKVMVLRKFRDEYLLTNAPGRFFVAYYYRHSPPIAALVRQNEAIRFLIRLLLAPLIFICEHAWLVLWTLGLSMITGGRLFVLRKRMKRAELVPEQSEPDWLR